MHKASDNEPVPAAEPGRQRDEEAYHRVEEHSVAQEPEGAPSLRHQAEGDLREHVAVEEGAQNEPLLPAVPGKAVLACVRRLKRRSRRHRRRLAYLKISINCT